MIFLIDCEQDFAHGCSAPPIQAQDRLQGQQAGMNDYLAKPFRSAEVLASIHRLEAAA